MEYAASASIECIAAKIHTRLATFGKYCRGKSEPWVMPAISCIYKMKYIVEGLQKYDTAEFFGPQLITNELLQTLAMNKPL